MGEGLGERVLLVLHSAAANLLSEITVSPLRRLTFFKRQKSKQKRCAPPSGSRFAQLPSLHHCSEGTPRRAIPGPSRLSRHPCRSTLSTTIPFGLLKGRLAAPDRSLQGCQNPSRRSDVSRGISAVDSINLAGDAIPDPVRRPSGGAVERGVWHGCQTRNDGPGMAHRDDPRSSAGAREVSRSETQMPGALSLWLLSLSREQRESDSP